MIISDPQKEIPIIDLHPYLSGSKGALDELGLKVRHIQESIGFWAVVNHGVSSDVLDSTYDHLKRFFGLPEEQKLKYKINELSVGYVPPKSTKYITSIINENTKEDLNETLITALDRDKNHPLIQRRTRFVGPNQWPIEVDGFKEAIVKFQSEILKLGKNLLPIFATALELPGNYFDAVFTDPVMWSRNTHYPAVKPEVNQYGIAPHSDHSFLTMLPMTEVPGLQILGQDNQWIDAVYVENAILINTGEFLNRWSNGRFIPTPHRVIPPQQSRYSIATFFNPNPDTIANPFETCCSNSNPAKYEPMSLIDYLCWYIDTNYQRSAGGQQN